MIRIRTAVFISAFATAALCLSSCATSGKKKGEPDPVKLSRMEGKKVALAEVDGEETARNVVEVALVNQLVQRGSFILISKEEVTAARMVPDQDPEDLRSLGDRLEADYVLRAKVLQFDAPTREGYSSETKEDSQMAAERGKKDAKVKRQYKVKSQEGHVKVQMDFMEVRNGHLTVGLAEAQDKEVAEAKDAAAHLTPKLRFLEKITNEAFRKFFDRYN